MHIVEMSKDLKEYLDTAKDIRAIVHSVYKEVINLVDVSGNLIVLLSSERDIEPMCAMVQCNSSEINSIKIDDEVILNEKGFFFKRLNRLLEIDNAIIWNQSPMYKGAINSPLERNKKLEELKQLLLEKGVNSGLLGIINMLSFDLGIEYLEPDCESNNDYIDFIIPRIVMFLNRILNKEYGEAIELLPKIIGFGPGLTPSTDDILAGVVVSLVYSSNIIDLDSRAVVDDFAWKLYKISIGRTTKVSERMLWHASRGEVSKSYRELIRNVFFKQESNFEKVVIDVINHGASSGSDFLLGVYLINKILLMNREVCENDKI